MFKTFYRGALGGSGPAAEFGGGIHEESWSDEDSEDEAEYGGEDGLRRRFKA